MHNVLRHWKRTSMANHTTEHRTKDGRIIKPVSIPRQVGLYARREREAQGLTRKQLAKAAGVSERLLASLELGDAPGIRLDKLLAVYDALGLELFTIGEHIPWEHNESSAASDSTDTAPATRTAAQRRRRGARATTRPKRTESSPELRLSDFQSAYDKLIANIFHDNSGATAR